MFPNTKEEYTQKQKAETLKKIKKKEWEYRCIAVGVCPDCAGDLDNRYTDASRWCKNCETLWLGK